MDQWRRADLDLDAYLARIDRADVDRAPTGETLAALHRGHLASIPFENLDIAVGRGIRVDLDAVQHKLVDDGRGGYCYEHGTLFAAVLEHVGFTVDRLLARVGQQRSRPRPRTHMALRVTHDDRAWLADVGFGTGLLEPLPWLPDTDHHQGDWTYRLRATGPGSWALRERGSGDWRTLYEFDDQPQQAADVEMANHWTSTHSTSPFVGAVVVICKGPTHQVHLHDRRRTTIEAGTTTEAVLGDDDVVATIADLGLDLSPAMLDDVLAALGPPPDAAS